MYLSTWESTFRRMFKYTRGYDLVYMDVSPMYGVIVPPSFRTITLQFSFASLAKVLV